MNGSRARRLLRGARARALAAAEWLGDGAFNRRTLAAVLHREHVLCLGDSHVAVMRHAFVPHVWFRAKPLVGATASGVLNPQSRSNSLERFSSYLQRAQPWQRVLLELGEVDCGFLIWHRAARRGLSVEEQLTWTIDSYATFIARVRDQGFAEVIVLSVPLPTISDDSEEWGEIASLRSAVTASQAERTDLTLRFNAALAERCRALGVTFIDVTSAQLDPATGLIARGFLRETHLDHHLADEPYAALVSAQLAGHWHGEDAGPWTAARVG